MEKKNKVEHSDKIVRDWNGQKYEKTEAGWSRMKDEPQVEQPSGQKEYTDEELDKFARSASDMGLKKSSQSGNERMRVAAKRELMRRRNEGVDAPAPTGNPFDDSEIQKGSDSDTLEKGKRAAIGEIRDWDGKKYQKTVNGWVPVKQGKTGPKSIERLNLTEEQKSKLSKFYDPQDAYNHFLEFDAPDMHKDSYQNFVEWASDGRDTSMVVESLASLLGITPEQALELDKEYNEKLIKNVERFFQAPVVGTVAEDYNGERVEIKAVADLSDEVAVRKLLSNFDRSGAMADQLEEAKEMGIKYIVGVDSDYGKTAYVWGEEGVSYPNAKQTQSVQGLPERNLKVEDGRVQLHTKTRGWKNITSLDEGREILLDELEEEEMESAKGIALLLQNATGVEAEVRLGNDSAEIYVKGDNFRSFSVRYAPVSYRDENGPREIEMSCPSFSRVKPGSTEAKSVTMFSTLINSPELIKGLEGHMQSSINARNSYYDSIAELRAAFK